MSLKFWSFIAFPVIMMVTLCRIYSKEHRTRIGSWTHGSKVLLITGQEKLFHLKIKIEVSTVSQITSPSQDRIDWVLFVYYSTCAFIFYINFNIWLSGPAKFPGIWRNGPLFCRYRNYLDAKMTIFQSLEKYFFFCILNVTRHVNWGRF